MYARVTSGQIAPDQLNDMFRQANEEERQEMARQPGFKGTFGLADRQTGKVMTVGL